jgi:16S rRNA (adenine(1408)-N(1))-methyltransferase
VIVDAGTGDGRAVLRHASSEPGSLIIGLDAAADPMAETSRRAARRGPRNAVFLAAGIEAVAGSPLGGRADLVTIRFPWGSLLRGMLGLDGTALCGVASLLAPEGRLEVLASIVPSDHVDGVECLDVAAVPAIRRAWSAAGLDLVEVRPATGEEVLASGSTWARRLGTDRPVWRLDGRLDRRRLG